MVKATISQIKDYINGKSVAIVCSGVGCLENDPGIIDSFDIVVRVNNYKTKGNYRGTEYDYTQKVGARTDIFYSFFGSSIKKTKEEIINDGVKYCLCKCPDSRPIESAWHIQRNKIEGIDFRPIYRRRQGYFPVPVFIPDDKMFLKTFTLLGNHVPTTGFSAVRDIMAFNPSKVYLTGFDGFASKVHNVDETWKSKNTDDPIGHIPEKEKEIIIDMYKQNIIDVDKYFKRKNEL